MRIGDYETHPVADVHRLLEGGELQVLVDSIKEHGQREPIWRLWVDAGYDNGTKKPLILDGRNRLRACEVAKVKPEFKDYTGKTDLDSLLAFSRAMNEARRHDTFDQRAMAAARALPLHEEAAKERQRAAGRVHGRGMDSSGSNDPELSPRRARDEAGEHYGVSGGTVERGRVVIEKAAPEVVAAVDSGKLAVSAAAKIADKPKKEQRAILEMIEKDEAKNVQQAVRRLEERKRVEAAPTVMAPTQRVLQGDAVELVRSLDVAPHCVVMDPPYGLDVHCTRRGGQDYDDGEDYALTLLDEVCAELTAKLDPTAHIYVFSGYTYAHAFKQILLKHFEVQDNPIVWVKDNHTMCDFAKWYPSKHEYIWFAKMRGSERRLAACVPDVLNERRSRESTHSAEKPVPLLQRLIEQSTVPGEVVLDPFMGSGSTGVAAKQLSRAFVGIEQDAHWAGVARGRIAA